MSLLSRTCRAVFTASAGLALSLSIAAPAAAEHPETEPQPYFVQDTGEDGCTEFHSQGEIHRPATHPDGHDVAVSGWKAIAIPDVAPGFPNPCNPVINDPRHIEFTFYGSGYTLGEHLVPFPESDSGVEYEFTMTRPAPIDTVTVAICKERGYDGVNWPDRCGEAQTITLEDTEPEDPYCQYSYSVTQWSGGYLAEIGITPLVQASANWSVEVDLPEGGTIASLWNAEVTQSGSTVTITNTGWNATVQAGSTAWIGFVGSGEAPGQDDIRVYVDGNACVDAAGA
ncbi:hypothetical protein GCM10027447_31610 [Glycomyces halotolerans]